MLFGVSFQETHQNDKVIRRSIFQKCPGIIIFHWATSAFGSLLTQLTQERENSPEVHCILLQLLESDLKILVLLPQTLVYQVYLLLPLKPQSSRTAVVSGCTAQFLKKGACGGFCSL